MWRIKDNIFSIGVTKFINLFPVNSAKLRFHFHLRKFYLRSKKLSWNVVPRKIRFNYNHFFFGFNTSENKRKTASCSGANKEILIPVQLFFEIVAISFRKLL